MSERMYSPGSRDKKRFNPNSGRISKNRLAWLRTAIGQLVIMKYPHQDEPDEHDPDPNRPKDHEVGTSYILLIPQQGRRPVTLNITALTLAEFKKTRQIFNLLFELAEPVIRERDQVARDAFTNGDDSYNRLYREVPTLVIREGEERPNIEGVQYGPSGVPDGADAGGDGTEGLRNPEGGVRRDGDELVDGQPPESLSQDDGPAPDQP